jgi:uncharacterized membrane protein
MWRAQVAGKAEEWEAEIVEQVPNSRIARHTIAGAKNGVLVTFEPVDGQTRITLHIMLQLEYDPEHVIEKVGDKTGFVSREVENDLTNFKKFIEEGGVPTGAWRDKMHCEQVDTARSGRRK